MHLRCVREPYAAQFAAYHECIAFLITAPWRSYHECVAFYITLAFGKTISGAYLSAMFVLRKKKI